MFLQMLMNSTLLPQCYAEVTSYLTVPLYPSPGAWPSKKLGRILQPQTGTAGTVAPPALQRAAAAGQVYPGLPARTDRQVSTEMLTRTDRQASTEMLTRTDRPAHVA